MAAKLSRHSRPAAVAGTIVSGALVIEMNTKFLIDEAHADSKIAPSRVFGRGPAFLSLPLESAKMLSSDTKLLRFKFSNKDAVSGLPLTGMSHNGEWAVKG